MLEYILAMVQDHHAERISGKEISVQWGHKNKITML